MIRHGRSTVLAASFAFVLAACGGQTPPPPAAEPEPAPAPAPAAEPAPVVPAPVPAATPAPAPVQHAPAPAPKPAAPAPKPAAPPAPNVTAFVVPAGTEIVVDIHPGLSSKTSILGQKFTGTVTQAVAVEGHEAIAVGSTLHGTVQEVKSAAHWDKGGLLVLAFDQLTLPSGESFPMQSSLQFEGKSGSTGKRAGIIGGSAAGGAILGKVIGKDTKDAAIGAVIGGAIGTGIAAGQKGEEVEIPDAASLTIQLSQAVEVKVPA